MGLDSWSVAGKTQSFSFPKASVERLWQACVRAIGELGYNVILFADAVAELLPRIPEPKAAGPTPARAAVSTTDELLKLAQLRDSGVLTQDEFEAQKAKLLGGQKSTNVRCNKCEHVQAVAQDQETFFCAQCGTKLRRKTQPR